VGVGYAEYVRPPMHLLLVAALASLPGLPGDYARASTFCACGDADGDGTVDIALGLPRDDAHGEDAGRVFVISGKDGRVLRELHGEKGLVGFGYALAGGVDIDGDGQIDLAVAAHRDGFPQRDPPNSRSGELHVFTLGTGKLAWKVASPLGTALGRSFASAAHASS